MDYKQFEETKELVIQVMNENKIGYNRDILRMGSSGYPNDACQDLAEECLELMAEYCRAGINGGFNGSIKDSLDALSDICAQMSNRKKDRDADKRREACEKKKNEIVRDIKLPEIEEVPIKDLVYQYIDRSMQAISGLIKKNPAQAEILRSSEKKLIQLRTSIEKAVDGSSKDAYGKAEKIIEHIQAWRDAAAASGCTNATLGELDEAVGIAHEWNKLMKPVKGSSRADGDTFTYKEDDIDKIAKSAELKERMDNLRARINTARSQLDVRYNVTNLEARRTSIRENIAKIEARREEAVESYKIGVITDDDLIDISEDLDEQLEDLRADLSDVNANISMKEQGRRNQEGTIDEVEKICDEIDSYETEPAIYSTLADNVSFESVDAIVGGVASAEQIQKFTKSLRINLAVAKKIRQSGGVIKGTTQIIKQEARDEMRKQKEEERAERAKNKGVTPEDAERIKQEKLAKILGHKAPTGGDDPQPVDPIDLPTRRKNDDLR